MGSAHASSDPLLLSAVCAEGETPPSPRLPRSHRLRMPRCEQKDKADSNDIPQRAPVTERQLSLPRGPVHMSISITEGRLNASLRLANPDKVRQQLGQHPAWRSPSAAARTHVRAKARQDLR